mmetsp:Transcript_10864/g.19058  ORF Transcript_10864/g.19058 Transcript_10864/m.19058 type:complete len:156 (-) Transcript_10864:39-506(-)
MSFTSFDGELTHTLPITHDDIRILRPIFLFYDSNCDGFLDPYEAELAFCQLGYADAQISQKIDMAQFLRTVGVIKKKQLEKELDGKLRHVFSLINVKGRRKITSEVLHEYLRSISVSISKEHTERLCELISSQEKHEFTESEFIRFLMPLCRPPP